MSAHATNASSSLAGRVAIVTGAAGLLGREHVIALAGAGATVVATDIDITNCRADVVVAADITRRSDLERLRDAVCSRFERIDILINNAAHNDHFRSIGPGEECTFETYPLELWQRALDVNVSGAFLACQVLGSVMAARGSGSIVNIASTFGIVAPDQSLYRRPDGTQAFYKSAAYPVTKAALLGLTRYLAAYWGHRGVRVNALSPGGVENGQEPFFVEAYGRRTPLGRMAQATDYRGALVFLASDASTYMTGANLVVDGGYTIW